MMQEASWTEQYIGLPYKEFGRSRAGVDCWGLVCMVYNEQYNRVLDNPILELKGLRNHWEPIAKHEMKVGDIIVFRVGYVNKHVGIYVGGNRFLHAEHTMSELGRLSSSRWSSSIYSIYRWKK